MDQHGRYGARRALALHNSRRRNGAVTGQHVAGSASCVHAFYKNACGGVPAASNTGCACNKGVLQPGPHPPASLSSAALVRYRLSRARKVTPHDGWVEGSETAEEVGEQSWVRAWAARADGRGGPRLCVQQVPPACALKNLLAFAALSPRTASFGASRPPLSRDAERERDLPIVTAAGAARWCAVPSNCLASGRPPEPRR